MQSTMENRPLMTASWEIMFLNYFLFYILKMCPLFHPSLGIYLVAQHSVYLFRQWDLRCSDAGSKTMWIQRTGFKYAYCSSPACFISCTAAMFKNPLVHLEIVMNLSLPLLYPILCFAADINFFQKPFKDLSFIYFIHYLCLVLTIKQGNFCTEMALIALKNFSQ